MDIAYAFTQQVDPLQYGQLYDSSSFASHLQYHPFFSCNGVREIEILAPPVTNCCNCKSLLIAQNKTGTVTVFSGESLKTAMKLSLRCKDCKLNYGYSMFGNIQEGYHFYKEERPYVEASDGVFMERRLCLFQVSLA